MGFEKVGVTGNALELPPGVATRMPIGPDIPPPDPAVIPTTGIRAELERRVHRPRAPIGRGHEQRRDGRRRREVLFRQLTGGTAGLVREPRKRLQVSRALLGRIDGIGRRLVRCGLAPRPHPIPGQIPPQEPHQQEVVEKDVVCPLIVSPLIRENDDRLPFLRLGNYPHDRGTRPSGGKST